METWNRKRRIYEHFVCVYLDPNLHLLDKKHLEGDTSYGYEASKFFYDPDECIDYITNLVNRKVYLILSASIGAYLVPLIYLLPQILSIYIHVEKTTDEQRYEEIFKPFRMIVRVISSRMDVVSNQMSKDIMDSTSYVGMELLKEANNLSPSSLPQRNDNDVLDIRYQQEPEFLYGQLIKDSLLQLSSSAESRNDFIKYCRSQYLDNRIQLEQIDRFQETYSRDKTFWWYSKDSFVYRLVNQALREQNIPALYNLRYYLKDLHECITGYHCRFLQTSLNIHSLKVYRGFAMSTNDFSQLNNKIGGLFSINSFLSTSRRLDIAHSFAAPYVGLPDVTPLLLLIDVDFYSCRTPFADIRHESEMYNEEEVLFTMGTVFRIVSIELKDDWQIWQLNLQLTDDQDERLGYMLLYRKAELFRKSLTPEENFVRLMTHLNQWSLAEKICHEILEKSPMCFDLHHQLGIIYQSKRDYDKAIECYRKALETSEDEKCPSIYMSLGNVCREKEDYPQALTYYELARNLFPQKEGVITNKYDLANYYCAIAVTHNRAGNKDQALEFFEKSSHLLRSDDPFQVAIYNNMAVFYTSIENYEKAIEYCRKTLAIQTRLLPDNHPGFATIYANLAIALYNYHDLESALEYMEKAYKIEEKNSSEDQESPALDSLRWVLRITEELCEQEKKN